MNYSIIVPLYNEEKNVKLLNKELVQSIIELKKTKQRAFELIFVDDGSQDNTFNELKSLNNKTEFPTVIVKHRKNISQSAALLTGIGKFPSFPKTIHKPDRAKTKLKILCHLGFCLKKKYSNIVVHSGIK